MLQTLHKLYTKPYTVTIKPYTESQRVKESKSQRDKESKGQRVKETKSQRDKERKSGREGGRSLAWKAIL